MKTRALILILFLMRQTLPLWAGEIDAFQFFQEEAKVVSVASKVEERVSDAPGIVSMYTDREIRDLGYYTLGDLANITSGFHAQTAYDRAGYEVDGLSVGRQWDNNYVLEMVDGISINQSRDYHAPAGDELPLYFAKRVEFLKGPASALYGTSAFEGVVNVVSKDAPEDKPLFEAMASAGGPYDQRRYMTNTAFQNDDVAFKLFLAYSSNDSQGDSFTDSVGNGHISQDNNDHISNFFNSSLELVNEDDWYKGFKAGTIYSSRRGGLGTGWMGFSDPNDDLTYSTFIPYLAYDRTFAERWNLQAQAKYNEYIEQGHFAFVPQASPVPYDPKATSMTEYKVVDPDYEGKVDLTYDVTAKANIKAGLDYDERYEAGNPTSVMTQIDGVNPFVPDPAHRNDTHRFDTRSAYLQAKNEFPILAGLEATAGARYDNGFGYDHTSPRVGLVQKVTDELSIKALYGSAILAPGIKQIGYNEEKTEGTGISVPNIKPETIDTYDGSVVWFNRVWTNSVTYFYSKISNPIESLINTHLDGGTYFGNSSEYFLSDGVELDSEYKYRSGKFFANATFEFPRDENGQRPGQTPMSTANLGAMVEFQQIGLTVSPVIKYVGAEPLPPGDGGLQVANYGPYVKAHADLDLNLIKKMNKSVDLQLQIRNALNQTYYTAGEAWQTYNYQQPGRQILLSVEVKI